MSKKNEKELFKSVDTISKELDVVDNFVLKHWKKYIVLAIILLICYTLFMFFEKSSLSNQYKTMDAINSANTVSELQDVLKKYKGHKLSDFANLRLAALLSSEKKYPEALAIYEKLESSVAEPFVKYTATLNEGYVKESLGQKEKALEIFIKVADNSSAPAQFIAESCYSAGRIYFDLNNKDAAAKYLNKCSSLEGKVLGWPTMANGLLNITK